MNNTQIQKKDLIQLYLNNGFDRNEAEIEIDFAIEVMCGLTSKDLILGIMPSPTDINKLKNLIEIRTTTHKPIAQLLGKTFFMGQKFDVNEHTLIPRPETELLTRKAIEIIKEEQLKQILDIGTGSGCIACMIAKLTNSQVLGVDISNEALKVALNNVMHMDLMNKAIFRKSNLFEKVIEKFDMIVSNPPYIPKQEYENLQIEVKEYEPATALFTDDKYGVEFYEKIAKEAPNYLNNKGHILFEIGINQKELVENILKNNGFTDIETFKDVSGTDRVVKGKLK